MSAENKKRRFDRVFFFGGFSLVALVAMYPLKQTSSRTVLVLAFMICVSLFYVGCRMVSSFFRNKPTAMWSSLAVIVVVAPLFAYFGEEPVVYALTTRQPRVIEILIDGRLPDLPTSAIEVRTHEWFGMFTGVAFLKFQAPASDINQWLESWEETEKQTATLLPLTPVEPMKWRSSKSPDWFTPTTEMTGRWYLIPDLDGHNNGDIIVDDASNVVYIRVIWS